MRNIGTATLGVATLSACEQYAGLANTKITKREEVAFNNKFRFELLFSGDFFIGIGKVKAGIRYLEMIICPCSRKLPHLKQKSLQIFG
ncbi:MAG: hypothetical protein HC896_00645 [Bacteroidales bacterium]|nr:hypothetical protein [Bacteroidales bacterium]